MSRRALLSIAFVVAVGAAGGVWWWTSRASESVENRNVSVSPTVATGDFLTTLTKTTWCNQRETSKDTPGFAPTSREWAFNPDGTYTFSYFSDYPEGQGQGRWSLHTLSPTSGLVTLGTGSAYFLAIEDGKLRMPLFTLEPCGLIASSPGIMPVVVPSALYTAMLNRTWTNPQPQFPFYEPTSIIFHDNGVFDAKYRNGECSHTGEWSLLASSETQTPNRPMQLVRRLPQNSCDSRGTPGLVTLVDDVSISDNRLTIDPTIYSAER